jgi:hypothetical protein
MADDTEKKSKLTGLEVTNSLESLSANSLRIFREGRRPGCCDPDQRKALANERPLKTPKEIYSVYGSFRSDVPSGPKVYDLLGVYTSSALAAHDARCWLISKQLQVDETQNFCLESTEYQAEYEGCHQFYSPPTSRQLNGGQFTARTEKVVLH